MKTIQNPILRGFNPDPSIIRVGEDYFIATSTFEWFPGVQIHHSRDLVNWELIARPLNRLSQLDMRGNPDSCGVWAPCLSYDKGTFYLVYSNVRTFAGVWKDTPNYLVTTDDIRGDWSDPIFLNSSGFDGSLFHDDDGRKWYLSMLVDHRKGKFFGGIILQEYDEKAGRLVGPRHHIFEGTELGKTEGPHIYKKDGWYYLITAEGGTEYEHAVTLARSKNLMGPYEFHPQNPVLSAGSWSAVGTASQHPTHHDVNGLVGPHHDVDLQKTGHADMVADAQGNWYIVCLTGRPLTPKGRCILGRETLIEELIWKPDGWPYLKAGGRLARVEIPIQTSEEVISKPERPLRDDFDSNELNIHFQSLRVPITENWLSLTSRPGWLRLIGRESLSSFHDQSLVARRVQHFHTKTSTCLDFRPTFFQQMAGLVCYYNTYHWHYLCVMGDESGKRYVQIVSCDKYTMSEPLGEPILLPGEGLIYLKADFNREALQFYYGLEEGKWQAVGPVLDGSILSDDYVQDAENRYRPAFTGSFVGICCQDLTGGKMAADFDWFEYCEVDNTFLP